MKETQEIKEYRHELTGKISDIMSYINNAEIDDVAGRFTTQEIEALRIGALAALSSLADIMLGSFDEIVRPELIERGMNESPKDLAMHIIQTAVLAHKHFVIDKE